MPKTPNPNKITKADLVNAVAKDASLTKKKAAEAVESVFDTIKAATLAGKKTIIAGFGKFELKARAPRKARNPKTGAPIAVAARKVPVAKLTFKFIA